MRLKKSFFNIYTFLLVSIFFDAYAIFYIQSYPVTLFTIVSMIYVIKCILKRKKINLKLSNQNVLLLVLIVYLIFNYIWFGFNHITSFLQAVYFLILGLLAYREESKETFDKYCLLYQKIMTYMSIYGIYQFIGRLSGAPFTDIIINNHMVTGYNWSNSIYIVGQTVYRSNAVFREPSYFAQMLAISLLLYIPLFFTKEKKEKNFILTFILQLIALIMTFSGTGIFMLIIGFSIYASIVAKNKLFWKKIVPITVLGLCIAMYALIFTSLGQYFLNRVNELFIYTKDASSGFVRFRAWIEVVKESWNSNIFLGSGIGTGAEYVSQYIIHYFGMSLNGFARVATELGVIGLILWCGCILSFFKKRNILISNNYLLICCSIIPLIFTQEAFSSNLFWMLIMFVNCKLNNSNKGER